MSYTNVVTNPIQQAIIALILIASGFSAGHSVQDQTVSLDEQFNEFDQFSYKAQEVNNMMQDTLANPTEERLRVANNRLKINYANWEHREYGENKELFHEYRVACQGVIDDLQERGEADTTEMNTLYAELVPSSQESHEENVKINKDAMFFWTT